MRSALLAALVLLLALALLAGATYVLAVDVLPFDWTAVAAPAPARDVVVVLP